MNDWSAMCAEYDAARDAFAEASELRARLTGRSSVAAFDGTPERVSIARARLYRLLLRRRSGRVLTAPLVRLLEVLAARLVDTLSSVALVVDRAEVCALLAGQVVAVVERPARAPGSLLALASGAAA